MLKTVNNRVDQINKTSVNIKLIKKKKKTDQILKFNLIN